MSEKPKADLAPAPPAPDLTKILADELKRVRERCGELETALEACRRIRTQRDLEFEQLLGRTLKLEAALAAAPIP
jgi:hypothetical protein